MLANGGLQAPKEVFSFALKMWCDITEIPEGGLAAELPFKTFTNSIFIATKNITTKSRTRIGTNADGLFMKTACGLNIVCSLAEVMP